MTYNEFINNILETRGRNGCGEEYHEQHHIVPKCMGGSNDKDNLIDLFAREHFEAHRLLALENPENEKLTYAWGCMAFVKRKDTDRYEVTAEEYEEARVAISNSLTGRCLSEDTKRKLSISHSIENLSEETLKKMSESAKMRQIGANNSFYGKHHTNEVKSKLSKIFKNKYALENNPFYGKNHTEETRRKMSECHADVSGQNNPMYSKHHSEKTRGKISESKIGKYRRENSKFSKIVIQFTNDLKIIYIYPCVMTASDLLKINNSSICRCCNNVYKNAGGFIWKYLYDKTRKDGTIIPGAISLGLISEKEALKMLEEQNINNTEE